MARLEPELIDQIANAAHDRRKRTPDASLHVDALPVDLDALSADLDRHGAPGAKGLGGAIGRFASLLSGQTAMTAEGPMQFGASSSAPDELGSAPAEAVLEAAETQLGFALPEELRQLYSIADGGFGPGGGLFPLAELVGRYRALIDSPFGPSGQAWPAELLPLFEQDPALLCIELTTGHIVAWDPEAIEDEESEADWNASFRAEHTDLAALLTAWLGEPTLAEQYDAIRREALAREMSRPLSPVTGMPMYYDNPHEQAESEIAFLAMTETSIRAEYGLPDQGWEAEVRRRHGIS